MTSADHTVLAQLANLNNPHHIAAISLVQAEIIAGNNIGITPQVIAEFLHVVTDARRFPDAITMIEALDWIDDFLENSNVELVLPTIASVSQSNNWMRQFQLGRKRILDTNLAAALHLAGCKRLITSNPNDFTIFNVFDLISP